MVVRLIVIALSYRTRLHVVSVMTLAVLAVLAVFTISGLVNILQQRVDSDSFIFIFI